MTFLIDIFNGFAKIQIYLKLFSRTLSSGCSETTPHDNFQCFDSKTNDHLILFWALWKRMILSWLSTKNNADRHLVHCRFQIFRTHITATIHKARSKLVHEKLQIEIYQIFCKVILMFTALRWTEKSSS